MALWRRGKEGVLSVCCTPHRGTHELTIVTCPSSVVRKAACEALFFHHHFVYDTFTTREACGRPGVLDSQPRAGKDFAVINLDCLTTSICFHWSEDDAGKSLNTFREY